MAHEQAASLKTVAEQKEAVFFSGVVRIVDQASSFIEKNRLRLLEGDAVFSEI